MDNNNETITKNHEYIIKWLEKKYKNKGTYRDLEKSDEFQLEVVKRRTKEPNFVIYPRLSIDLIRVAKDKEGKELEQGEEKIEQLNYYTLFFAISSKEIFKRDQDKRFLKKRLLFYQYYLSSITDPARVQIIVVILDNNDDFKSKFHPFLEENGFGLWGIKDGERENVVCQPKSLGTRMEEEIATFRDNKEKTVVGSYFDKYARRAFDALAYVTPDTFGGKYIDRTLLNKMLDLKNVKYGKDLSRLVNEHLDENDNDFAFVTEVFNFLWEKYIGIPYSKFLKTFEPVLLHVFAEGEEGERYYRDHYIHQFQVFLLGVYIMDKLYDDFIEHGRSEPEIKWLITSSFHDIAYPVQLYDGWSSDFFKNIFKVKIKIAHLELKSNFVEQSFLSCMGYLIWELCRSHREDCFKDNWLADKDKRELVLFFHKEITEKKSHSILSSMSLLKLVQDFNFDEKNMVSKKLSTDKGKFNDIDDIHKDIIETVFVPSALAIALHDKEVWQKLRKESEKDNHSKILENLKFQKDPLSFLLVFCDNVQEWGRPSQSHGEKEEERGMRFELIALEGDKSTGLDITIRTPDNEEGEQKFIDKLKELTAIQFFLRPLQGRKFVICLEDSKEKRTYFEMQGSP